MGVGSPNCEVPPPGYWSSPGPEACPDVGLIIGAMMANGGQAVAQTDGSAVYPLYLGTRFLIREGSLISVGL